MSSSQEQCVSVEQNGAIVAHTKAEYAECAGARHTAQNPARSGSVHEADCLDPRDSDSW